MTAAPAADPSTGHAPPVLLPGLVVLVAMLLAATSMSAVFTDTAWLVQVIVMVAIVVLTGVLFRAVPALRASGLTVIAQFVVAVLAAVYLCVPGTLAAGVLPTGSSFGALFGELATGIDDIYRTTAPAESTPGFRTILTVGFGLITMLIDGLVSDIRAPKVAGILLLLVYIIPVLLAPRELRWWHFAAIAAAFLILMLSSYIGSAHLRSPVTAITAGALALALGVGLPVLLPDISVRPDQPVSAQGDLTVINPFLDLRSDLTSDDETVAFTYTTDDPLAPPVRLTSVSDFDGTTWMPAEFDLDPFAVAVEGLPSAPGVSQDTRTAERRTDIDIVDLDEQHLPAPYAPTLVDGVSRRWIYDPQTLTIVGNGEITAGAQYGVDYLSVEPTAESLRDAAPVSSTEFADLLALPDDTPEVIADTADEVTAGAENEWEKAVALQEYFRSDEFTYSTDAPEDASGDVLADFLEDKQGYCVQFSGAMTAMARSLGIPARIGVGFTGGTATGEGEYEVRINQAHAWPELWFEGTGWVRFEPTPGGPAGTPPPWTESGDEEDAEETASPEPTAEPTTEDAGDEGDDAAEPSAEPTEESTGGTDADSGVSWPLVVGLIGLAILLLALPALLRLVLRGRRLRTPLDPERVWEEIRALARDHGRPLAPATTVHEHLTRLGEHVPGPERDGLAAIGRAVDESRYAGEVRTPLDAEQVRETLRALRKGLAEDAGSAAAVRSRLWPASVFGLR